MATSSTQLVYALPIRASDLIAAARVYSKVGPTSLGLSLAVRSLKQHNVIPSWLGPEVPAINRVPVEVWEMVRQELIDLELRTVRAEVAELFHCPVCAELMVNDDIHEDLSQLNESKTLKQLKQESRDSFKEMRTHDNRFIAFRADWVDGVDDMHDNFGCGYARQLSVKWDNFSEEEVKKKAVSNVLATFGLTLPSKQVFHSESGDFQRSDSVVLIAADTSKHEHASAVPAKVVNDMDRHGVNNSNIKSITLGTDFFKKHHKLNLDNRFNRFFSTYSVTAHPIPKPPKPVTPGAGPRAGAPPAAAARAANAAAAGGAAGGAAVTIDDSSDDESDDEEKPTAGWIILNELARK